MDTGKLAQLSNMQTVDDIENERQALKTQVQALQRELRDSKGKCTDLERAVELLKCKNAKLELDVNSLKKELDDVRTSGAHFGRAESSEGSAASDSRKAADVSLRQVEKARSNFSFGYLQDASQDVTGKFKDQQPKDGQNTPAIWTTVEDVSDKLTSGEKTAPSQSGNFDDWKMRSLITTTGTSGVAQRSSISMGATGGTLPPPPMVKFPTVSAMPDQVKLSSDEESDNEVHVAKGSADFTIKEPDKSDDNDKEKEESPKATEVSFKNTKDEKAGQQMDLLAAPQAKFGDGSAKSVGSAISVKEIPGFDNSPDVLGSELVDMITTPCSQSVMYGPKPGVQKKSKIAIVEEEKKRRVSVINPGPIRVHLSNNNLTEFSKSIVFPKHTLKRITDEGADLNTTLHMIQQNYENEQMAKDNSGIDFNADESQIIADSSFCQVPQMAAPVSPKFHQHNDRIFASFAEKEPPKRSKLLFEDFLVVSVAEDEVKGVTLDGHEAFKPEILWQFKTDGEASSVVRMKSVKDFCFPDKVRASCELKPDSIVGGETLVRNENTFVFTLNGLDPEGQRLHEGNKNGWIFCICLRVNVDTGQKTKEGKPVTIPKVLCMTSYYEYFDLFFQTLHLVCGLSHMDAFDHSEPSAECKEVLHKLFETNVDNASKIGIPQPLMKSFSYSVPKVKDGTNAAAFFCGMLFSVLKPNDFFELMCNIMLEHSVVFVSQNYNLLTSAVLGCCSLLYPLKWEHIIIPIMPDMCLEILEAPVPFIVGVPKGISEGITFTKDAWCQQTAIVMLDLGKVFVCKCAFDSQEIMKKLPSLAGLAKGIEAPLLQFVKEPCKGALPYELTKTQAELVTIVCKRMRQALDKTVMGMLPKERIPKKEDGSLDMEKVTVLLKDSADAVDKEFIGLFCETQMFASLLEERYEL